MTYSKCSIYRSANVCLEHVPDGQLDILYIVARALVLRIVRYEITRIQRKSGRVLLRCSCERADGLQGGQREVVWRVALVVAIQRRGHLDGRRASIRRGCAVPTAHARGTVALGPHLVPGVEVQVREVKYLDPLAARRRLGGVGGLGLGEGELKGRHVGRGAVRAQVRAYVLPVEARHVGLGQDLRPGGAKAAGLVRRLARRV